MKNSIIFFAIFLFFAPLHGQDFSMGMKLGVQSNRSVFDWDRITVHGENRRAVPNFSIFTSYRRLWKALGLSTEFGFQASELFLDFDYLPSPSKPTSKVFGWLNREQVFFGIYPEYDVINKQNIRVFMGTGLEINRITGNDFLGLASDEWETRMKYHPRSLTDYILGLGFEVTAKNALAFGLEIRYKKTLLDQLRTDQLPGIGAKTLLFSIRLSRVFNSVK